MILAISFHLAIKELFPLICMFCCELDTDIGLKCAFRSQDACVRTIMKSMDGCGKQFLECYVSGRPATSGNFPKCC